MTGKLLAPALQPPPGPAEVFDAWAQHQVQLWEKDEKDAPTGRRLGFSGDAIPVYRSVWEVWLRWLDGQPPVEFAAAQWRWPVATVDHVRTFVKGPAPAAAANDRRRRKPIADEKMAEFTAQRYWRILRDVYAHAIQRGWLAQNPALGLDKEERPSVSRRARKPQVLPVFVLRMIRDPKTLVQLLPQQHDGHWWILRDRAIVALLAHCGMSAAELIALRGGDLRQGGATLHGKPPPQLEGMEPLPVPSVDLPGRTLELPDQALAAIHPWLEQRAELLVQQRFQARAQAKLQGQEPPPAATAPSQQQPLFLSREAPAGVHTRLDPSSLYVIVRRCLKAAYDKPRVKSTTHPEGYVAAGPAVIRNAVIQAWADHYGEDEAARMAGLQSPASLRRA